MAAKTFERLQQAPAKTVAALEPALSIKLAASWLLAQREDRARVEDREGVEEDRLDLPRRPGLSPRGRGHQGRRGAPGQGPEAFSAIDGHGRRETRARAGGTHSARRAARISVRLRHRPSDTHRCVPLAGTAVFRNCLRDVLFIGSPSELQIQFEKLTMLVHEDYPEVQQETQFQLKHHKIVLHLDEIRQYRGLQ